MTEFLQDYGLVVLFLVVAGQAAGGAGLPGKTALVTAAILAARGHFAIGAVLVVGGVALVLGGFAGYGIGRTGGRRLVDRFLPARLERMFGTMERFFDKHGPKAVFAARFLPGLKVVAAPAAGIARMRWWLFAFWHTLSAVAFTVGFGLGAYFAGEAAIGLVERYGAYALIPLVLIAAGWLVLKLRRRRRDGGGSLVNV